MSKMPPPNLIDSVDYETALAEMVASLKARFQGAGIAFDVEALETDPAVIIAQEFAYRLTLFEQRLNERFVSYLIDYSSGATLDQLAAFYDVKRVTGEGDERLQKRTRLAIAGRSAGGPAERYKSIAFNASSDVRDVKIYSDPHGIDPSIHVAVLSTATGGYASDDLLLSVENALQAKRVTSDRFHVASAVRKTVDVALDIWLTPDASESALEGLGDALRGWWENQDLLGLDLNHSDIITAVKTIGSGAISNVKVVSPQGDTEAWPAEALALGLIDVRFKGRGR
ncbi:baseplate J/gp47 family protein [Polycladidibacter hongkongensis]|uniref:baseplate J/gp47 family protein n=1 Tax=Polycladidibacter hongkongensis TaxID=1647556 RepID=UPI0008369FCF|nr:baseplate J/gp47 family protein [Pseudovibrio hongkongensis]